VPHEQHLLTQSGGELAGVERLAREAALDHRLDAERLARQLCGLQRSELRTGQARIELDPEPHQRLAGAFGLPDSALGQRPLVVRLAVRRVTVSQ
jgi:hypothetical protein